MNNCVNWVGSLNRTGSNYYNASIKQCGIPRKEERKWSHDRVQLVPIMFSFIKMIGSEYGVILGYVKVGCWVHGICYITLWLFFYLFGYFIIT